MSGRCEIQSNTFQKFKVSMKIIAINLLVISSIFSPTAFLGIQVTAPEGSCSFGAFRSNLPPDEEAVSFIKMGMNWIFHREVVALPTNQMLFVKVEVFTPGKRLQLQSEPPWTHLRHQDVPRVHPPGSRVFFLDSRVGKEKCRFK